MSRAMVPTVDAAHSSLTLLAIGLSHAREAQLRDQLPPDCKLDRLSVDEMDGGARLLERVDAYDALLLDGSAFAPDRRAHEVRSALARLLRRDPRAQSVVLIPGDDLDALRAAVEAGARDVLDPSNPPEAVAAGLRAAARMRRTLALDSGCAPLPGRPPEVLGQMIGASEGMRRSFGLMRRVAATDVPVLVNGESGTGKELAARAIHELGARSGGPFVAINCAAIPEPLLEAELFGHERGAFTGAAQARRGRVEVAHGGTLFLDEIGELAPALQGKLLRFLEDHTVERIGGRQGIPIDVRVIAATNRDLPGDVARGRFREDLYYRLAVFDIPLPPLRERGEDVVHLARLFLDRYGRSSGGRTLHFAPDAEAALREAPWPGNVRELINRVRRAVVVAGGARVRAADLDLVASAELPPQRPETLREARARAEVECIRSALEQNGGNKAAAARKLGVSRTQLYEIMNRHGMVGPAGR